jgi:dinuclear metal center YbgI/SA1388 family protein
LAPLRDIVSFLDELLEIEAFEDYGPNGLQVPGAEEIEHVATGVSAHRELFVRAAGQGAQLVLCHHGLFWNAQPRAVSPALKERLEVLFRHDMGLAAYHLPLDAHAEAGNNALICRALGLERAEPFGSHRGRPIGFVGRSDPGVPLAELVERCRRAFGREPFLWDFGPDPVESVGVVSGGGASSLAEAVELGLGAFLTGEPAEPAMADAKEGGIHFIAGGHYATETFGVRRLGELLAERFHVAHSFIDVPNPV